MPDSPLLSFGHHHIPLLSLPGAAGVFGGKVHLAAVKDSCKSAERIHGALALAGRFETALPSEDPDFFDPAPGLAKARNLAWEIIHTSQRLQWVIPTRNPEHISRSLPTTWIGKGFLNVCIGLMADGDDAFPEKLQALRDARVQHRAIFLGRSSASIDLAGQLHGIDWVVLSGNSDDRPLAATIESACREAGVAFLFHRTDGAMDSCLENGGADDDPPWPLHPFGTKILLSRPTLAALKSVSNTQVEYSPPAHAENKPEESYSMIIRTTIQPIDLPQEDPAASEAPPAKALKLEIFDPESVPPAPDSAFPIVSNAEHEDFSRLDAIVRRGLTTFIEVGHALAEIRDRELWRAGGHDSWAAYCPMVGGLTKTHANRLINSSEIARHLAQVTPIGVTPTAESQVRPLSKLKQPEQRVLAWSRAAKRANGQPTSKLISDVVAELMADGTSSTSSKPNRKQRAAEMIHQIRMHNTAGGAQEQIEILLNELVTLLKLA